MQSNHHHDPIPEPPTHQEVAKDALNRYQEIGSRYWIWVAIFSTLTVLGVIAFVVRLNEGMDDRKNWGYLIGTMAFLLTTFAATPIVSAGLRLTKAHFRRPFTRIAELNALSGIVILIILIAAVQTLPDSLTDPHESVPDLWFNFPMGAPDVWQYIGVGTMVLAGLALLHFIALPDLAAARDHLEPSWRQKLVSALSLGWIGNLRAWRVQYLGVLTFGAIYLMSYPLVQTLFSSDFHASQVPGLKDAIFPATVTLVGLQGAVATLIVFMFVLRQTGGYANYIGTDQFWSLSKPLLAFSLLWFYFWWASFLTFWYGRTDGEVNVLQLLYLGPYRDIFMASLFLNFLGPMLALIWNPVRKSIWGPTLVATFILIGSWLNMMRIYVSASSVPDSELGNHYLHAVPSGMLMPGLGDLMMSVGAISACALVFLLASKVIPVISIWEVGEGLRLVKVRRFYGRWVRVIAKSH